jgi:hypothetical protein
MDTVFKDSVTSDDEDQFIYSSLKFNGPKNTAFDFTTHMLNTKRSNYDFAPENCGRCWLRRF